MAYMYLLSAAAVVHPAKLCDVSDEVGDATPV